MHTFLIVAGVFCLVVLGFRVFSVVVQAINVAASGKGEVSINFVGVLWGALGLALMELSRYVH